MKTIRCISFYVVPNYSDGLNIHVYGSRGNSVICRLTIKAKGVQQFGACRVEVECINGNKVNLKTVTYRQFDRCKESRKPCVTDAREHRKLMEAA